MMKHGRREDDVERFSPSSISRTSPWIVSTFPAPAAEMRSRAVQHRLAEVNQRNIELRQAPKHLQRIIPCPATDIQQPFRTWRH